MYIYYLLDSNSIMVLGFGPRTILVVVNEYRRGGSPCGAKKSRFIDYSGTPKSFAIIRLCSLRQVFYTDYNYDS